MKDLGKWQFISFVSRGLATVVGILQTLLILKFLSKGEWGDVQYVISVGSIIGVVQHLGLASASTREISAAKDDSEIFKVFLTSAFVRYLITFPLAFGLFLLAPKIAGSLYGSNIVNAIRLYSFVILFQGVQSILNSVISGTKRFKHLFTYQVVFALINAPVFLPFVYKFKIDGYFYAMLVMNIIASIALGLIAFIPLRSKLVFPTKADFIRLFKDIFSVSFASYIVKVIYKNWENLGSIIIRHLTSSEIVGVFYFANLYAKKIMHISDSATDVSLPVFSDKYVNDFENFKTSFVKNFDKLFISIIFSATIAGFWVREICFVVFKYISGGIDKYNAYKDSFVLVTPLLIAFILYALLNIVQSSVLIPAKKVRELVVSYVLLFVLTFGFFFSIYRFVPILPAMSWSMALGVFVAILYLSYVLNKSIKISFFNIDHIALVVQSGFITWAGYSTTLTLKSLIFLPLMVLLVWNFFIASYLTKEDLIVLKNKIARKVLHAKV